MPNRMTLGRIGVGIRHESGFCIDRPQGSGDCVFLHFLTPIRLLSTAGRKVERPGACILYTPPHPQWYTAAAEGFTHDWFHLAGADARNVIARYRLPENTVFRPARTDFIAGRLSEFEREKFRADPHWRQALALGIQLFLLRLSRELHPAGGGRLSAYEIEMREALRSLRTAVLQDHAKGWTVPALAAQAHLSVSRFSALYRRFFGTSPAQDLIRIRLDRACWLLSSTTLSIADVASASGFRNVYYFSRLFHRRMGSTARDYCRRPLRTPEDHSTPK